MAHLLINIAFVGIGLLGLAVMALTMLRADGRL